MIPESDLGVQSVRVSYLHADSAPIERRDRWSFRNTWRLFWLEGNARQMQTCLCGKRAIIVCGYYDAPWWVERKESEKSKQEGSGRCGEWPSRDKCSEGWFTRRFCNYHSSKSSEDRNEELWTAGTWALLNEVLALTQDWQGQPRSGSTSRNSAVLINDTRNSGLHWADGSFWLLGPPT